MRDNAGLKKGLNVLWFATGRDDGLITTTQATVDTVQEARVHAGVQGITRRAYLD